MTKKEDFKGIRERMNNFEFIIKKPDGTEQIIEREKSEKKGLQK